MKIINYLFWICCLGIYISCSTPKKESNKNEHNMEHSKEIDAKEVELVFDNPEKIKHGNISIGIGNIWEEEKSEKETPKFTAGLWVYFPDNEEKDIQQRIKEDQIIEAGEYTIRVIQIPDLETVVLGVSEK